MRVSNGSTWFETLPLLYAYEIAEVHGDLTVSEIAGEHFLLKSCVNNVQQLLQQQIQQFSISMNPSLKPSTRPMQAYQTSPEPSPHIHRPPATHDTGAWYDHHHSLLPSRTIAIRPIWEFDVLNMFQCNGYAPDDVFPSKVRRRRIIGLVRKLAADRQYVVSEILRHAHEDCAGLYSTVMVQHK